MKVVHLSSEVAPFAKTGGLADVAGSLPGALSGFGLDVRVLTPYYRETAAKGLPLRTVASGLKLDFAGKERIFDIIEHRDVRQRVWLIACDEYFNRDHLYGPPSGDYADNGERFGFFSRASLETLKALDFSPDILHLHDWQTGLVPAYLKFSSFGGDFFENAKTLFTIHNLAYQGLFDPGVLSRIGLPDRLFDMTHLEFHGRVSFLKAGLLYSRALTTVSPRYSREILTPEFGCGFDGLLRSRAESLTGILNGIDYADWNPETDPHLPAPYSRRDLSGKAVCREALLESFALRLPPEVPIAGMVTRLAEQKGLDIVCDALGGVLKAGAALVILGTGDAAIQDMLSQARKKHPDVFGLRLAFDEKTARIIYAGSDMFLIPSRYEPCGLTQMYSLKYGTPPVVRATGGLDDTVVEFDPETGGGNGFKFTAASPEALLDGVARATAVFEDKEAWRRLVQNAMAEDFTWEKSARRYLELYESL